MKKTTNKVGRETHRLALKSETLRSLGAMELRRVAGGDSLDDCDTTTIDASLGRGCTTVGQMSDCPC